MPTTRSPSKTRPTYGSSIDDGAGGRASAWSRKRAHPSLPNGLIHVGLSVGSNCKTANYSEIFLFLAETEGFEPSIGLYNPITV
jgi:hypothetical protein